MTTMQAISNWILKQKIKHMLRRDKSLNGKIAAIKFYRNNRHEAGLKEAKDCIDELVRSL